MDIQVSAEGSLKSGTRRMRCALGRAGTTHHKTEGDGATPIGSFVLRRAMYRADRIELPSTALPVRPIARSDGWCDDPRDQAYNRLVTLPYPASAESLWRCDTVYDVVVVLGQNDDPPEPGAGSAIFLHVARHDFAPTEGCIAVSLPDLLVLLAAAAPGDRIRVVP